MAFRLCPARPVAAATGAALVGVLLASTAGTAGARQNLQGTCGNTVNNFSIADSLYDGLNNNGDNRIGPRRLVVEQSGWIRQRGTRLFVQRTPMDIARATIRLRKTRGRARTTVAICATSEGAGARQEVLSQFEIPAGKGTRTFTRELTGLRDKRVSVYLKGKSLLDTISYTLNFKRPGAGEIWQPTSQQLAALHRPVEGFADLHVHHASRWAFGGGWYFGPMDGPIPPDPRSHSRPLTVSVAGFRAQELRPEHGGRTIPAWDDTSHQQMGVNALRSAHENGLGLIVSSGVNSEWLCGLLAWTRQTLPTLSCNDMESAKNQIRKMKEFDAAHDWYRIVTNPWEARDAMYRGQLAVILGIEVSNIFPSSDGDWRKQLDDLYDMGVRQVYLSHESNNRFGGTAYHHTEELALPNRLTAWFSQEVVYATEGTGRNAVGLSRDGRNLIREMMRRNMLIDVDHLSWRAVDEVARLTRAEDYYPIYAGHTRLEELLTPEHREVVPELNTPATTFEYIRERGGMIGLRTGPERARQFSASGVTEDCGGSVKSLIQTYRRAVTQGMPVAFGTDLNGFVTMTGPRFGPDACPDAPTGQRAAQVAAQELPPVFGRPSSWPVYEQRGIADISTEPSVIFDMKSLGVDTTSIENSAQAFLNMWDRAYRPDRARVP